ncbi:M67 family metallopeptidase [Sphingobium sp.]|uniref:M67 family metallopeptidase n=1 Tax=Sphingobium sp. TaxID=1912891 RepID=UPI002613D7E2|nr:M67 family metallopeptidase [Sphingobium sp.]
MRVVISRGLLEQIVALAADSADEICGLLLGQEGRIEAIASAANVASDPARHFELDPAVLIAAHRAARSGGPAVLGHYHSHPSGVAAPSATDAACAAPDGSLWMILGGGEVTLWRAGPDTAVNVHFTKVQLDRR